MSCSAGLSDRRYNRMVSRAAFFVNAALVLLLTMWPSSRVSGSVIECHVWPSAEEDKNSAVAMDEDGRYVVVWQEFQLVWDENLQMDLPRRFIMVRPYGADGAPADLPRKVSGDHLGVR